MRKSFNIFQLDIDHLAIQFYKKNDAENFAKACSILFTAQKNTHEIQLIPNNADPNNNQEHHQEHHEVKMSNKAWIALKTQGDHYRLLLALLILSETSSESKMNLFSYIARMFTDNDDSLKKEAEINPICSLKITELKNEKSRFFTTLKKSVDKRFPKLQAYHIEKYGIFSHHFSGSGSSLHKQLQENISAHYQIPTVHISLDYEKIILLFECAGIVQEKIITALKQKHPFNTYSSIQVTPGENTCEISLTRHAEIALLISAFDIDPLKLYAEAQLDLMHLSAKQAHLLSGKHPTDIMNKTRSYNH